MSDLAEYPAIKVAIMIYIRKEFTFFFFNVIMDFLDNILKTKL